MPTRFPSSSEYSQEVWNLETGENIKMVKLFLPSKIFSTSFAFINPAFVLPLSWQYECFLLFLGKWFQNLSN